MFTKFVKVTLFFLINVGVLLLSDAVLIRLDLFPSRKPVGDPSVGFLSPDRMQRDPQIPAEKPTYNEMGFLSTRSVDEIVSSPRTIPIAMVGDSHSYLVESLHPEFLHSFVLERDLLRAGFDVEMISAGMGRYSPLQEYLLYKHYLKDRFHPRILVMNLYSGNDWYDLLRVDDRPSFRELADGEILLEKPVWCVYRNPEPTAWSEKSRFMILADQLLGGFGSSKIPLHTRLQLLIANTRGEDRSLLDIARYVMDLRRCMEPQLAVPQAFAAQMLNQALFFKYFPKGIHRSDRYMRHLMRLMRQENEHLPIVISCIPSAALADLLPDRTLFLRALDRVGLSMTAVRKTEKKLYENLRRFAEEEGFVFVDILRVFETEGKGDVLYNPLDLHINQVACQLIGDAQADAIIGSGVLPK